TALLRRTNRPLLCPNTSPRRSIRKPPREPSGTVRAARCLFPASQWRSFSSSGSASISSCSCREVPLADTHPDPLQRPMPDNIVPAEVVARTEKRWLGVMLAMLIVMMAVVVLTGMTHAIGPPSNVETIDPTTLHLGGEFAESNLGTAQERDGSLTVRL